MRVLLPLPSTDFDPTESAVPWDALVRAGHEVCFATPDGRPARADDRVLTGRGLSLWRAFLAAGHHARHTYAEMEASVAFEEPLKYEQLESERFDALVLTGGHGPGMKPYLESPEVQALVGRMMAEGRPVGALCHGVLVMARARDPRTGRSVLHGRRTTALTTAQEMSAFVMTGLWLGRYYRTYAQTVQEEVQGALESPDHFQSGPFSASREGPDRPGFGFTVRDGNYLSCRYFGDAYRFSDEFVAMLAESP